MTTLRPDCCVSSVNQFDRHDDITFEIYEQIIIIIV